MMWVAGADTDLEIWTVSPGVGGFLAFFILALAVVFIGRGAVRTSRRIDHNDRRRALSEQSARRDQRDDDGDQHDDDDERDDGENGEAKPEQESAATSSDS